MPNKIQNMILVSFSLLSFSLSAAMESGGSSSSSAKPAIVQTIGSHAEVPEKSEVYKKLLEQKIRECDDLKKELTKIRNSNEMLMQFCKEELDKERGHAQEILEEVQASSQRRYDDLMDHVDELNQELEAAAEEKRQQRAVLQQKNRQLEQTRYQLGLVNLKLRQVIQELGARRTFLSLEEMQRILELVCRKEPRSTQDFQQQTDPQE